MSQTSLYLANEAATCRLAEQLLPADPNRLCGLTFALSGELGAGKTSFCRAFLRGLGHSGPVKSPTFTLVEPYQVFGLNIFHFDLYRLNSAEELEYMGMDDYFSDTSLCLIEWPERGAGLLPTADLSLHFLHEGEGRRLRLVAGTVSGQAIMREAALESGGSSRGDIRCRPD